MIIDQNLFSFRKYVLIIFLNFGNIFIEYHTLPEYIPECKQRCIAIPCRGLNYLNILHTKSIDKSKFDLHTYRYILMHVVFQSNHDISYFKLKTKGQCRETLFNIRLTTYICHNDMMMGQPLTTCMMFHAWSK